MSEVSDSGSGVVGGPEAPRDRLRDNIVTPEIVLLGDHAMSRVRWTLERETERLAADVAAMPELTDLLQRNGWTVRMLAWGHIINGLLDLAQFDDEEGRT
jgi:hypothetical protein